MSRNFILALLLCLLMPGLCRAINLGGRDIPRDRFVVYLFIGHSNMCGRVDDIDLETYDTHPRIWNYKFDDGTDAWIPAQAPVHRDVSWQRGGGPATPFLKKMAQDHPGYYFGVIQNAHAAVTCVHDYRRGELYYDELVSVTGLFRDQITLGGLLCMLGAMEAQNQARSEDFANQIVAMMGEMRADLAEPDLPLLINRLTRGSAYWQIVQDNILLLPSMLTFADIVPSDGPYKPNDTVHYTWVGQKAWGDAAADRIASNGWFPGPDDDVFAPQISKVEALDESTLRVVFDECLDPASAQTPGHYIVNPGISVHVATLDADQQTVTLTTSPLTSRTQYTLTTSGVTDLSANVTSNEATAFTWVDTPIPKGDLAFWVKADGELIRISGDFVPLWADQSGRENHAIRARFANQPLWVDEAINGKPVLRFNGPWDSEFDFMTRILPASYTGDSTLFQVFRIHSVGQAANASLFSTDVNGGDPASFQIEVDGNSPGTLQLYTGASYPIGTTTIEPGLLTVRISGTSLGFFLDGMDAGNHTIAASEAKTFGRYALATNRAEGEFLQVDIAEVLLYERALDAGERQSVELYLGAKYGMIEAPAGITVTPAGGLTTTEAGGSDTFTLVLDSQPDQDVIVPVSSDNPAEGIVAPTQASFSALNWSDPVTVTVTGVDDAQADGDVLYHVVLGASVSVDPDYSGLDPNDVSVTNRDDEGSVNHSPVAVINGPVATNVGISVSYFGGNSTDDGSIVVWNWDFDDGSVDSGELVSHSWNSEGLYNVALIVTDDGGLTDRTTLEVNVQSGLEPSVTLLSPVGGETWTAGSRQTIRYTTVDLSDIRIDFSADGGSTWSLVGYSDSTDPEWGAFPWDVPDIDSDQCVVMVQGYYFEAPTQSGSFTIAPGGNPDGGSSNGDPVSGGCGCTHDGPRSAVLLWLIPLMILWFARSWGTGYKRTSCKD